MEDNQETSMKRIPQALAIAFLGFGAANAQGPIAPHDTNVPIIEEPAASTLGGASKDQELANDLVQALNADASLKGSKMTVQPENGDQQGTVWITGVAKSEDQLKRVSEIAAAHAGGMGIANLVQVEHLDKYDQPDQELGAEKKG
jgi:osmotically-inducible protein OsmY